MHEVDFDINFGVLTISTSRFERHGMRSNPPEDDDSGRYLVEEFNAKAYMLIPDDVMEIRRAVLDMLGDVDVVITTGGTGLNPKDVTIEAVKPLIEKEIEGFGEIFRYLSYKEIGERAMLTRAFAGIVRGKAVFCLPGSLNAVKLGAKLIKSQVRHILTHARGLR
ncbi:MogA/MoaB family molybdenum cofactor biosynthesis protein [Archaeoglobus profundus]|uniref:Molybdenum cofactor synthesis domain protein n=1 Tax=Archaeoglobus profundus (strain DSM 5631 / JCM 9629 / NBRC 100127 / Av18) TaxID=572546 RepID=D2REH7_ARCPA|nr:MogA/MoaB family molybdenum cofactor biosynthesis protein [Archaeoglobus profundus]ADB58521.1 molybdenum cofactor synthesis domain protein [Archaeoglobus profundus DSM 5631]